jgi:hypothetical protein
MAWRGSAGELRGAASRWLRRRLVAGLAAAMACGGGAGLNPPLLDLGRHQRSGAEAASLRHWLWCGAGWYRTGRHHAELAIDGGALALGLDMSPFGPNLGRVGPAVHGFRGSRQAWDPTP